MIIMNEHDDLHVMDMIMTIMMIMTIITITYMIMILDDDET